MSNSTNRAGSAPNPKPQASNLVTEVLRALPDGVAVEVLASAGSAVSKVRGLHGGALKVAVRAAPEQGKANAEIVEVLAQFFGVPRNRCALIAGDTSRRKRVKIAGLEAAVAQQKIEALARGE